MIDSRPPVFHLKKYFYNWLILFVVSGLLSTESYSQDHRAFLTSALEKLSNIKTAKYFYTASASAPGDTLSFSTPRQYYVHEYTNAKDSLVKAKYLQFDSKDTSRLTEYYDGKSVARIDHQKHRVKVDSFKNYPHPFRLVYFPFFTRTANILNYALTTDDSIAIDVNDFQDSVSLTLTVYDKVIEFVTTPFVDLNAGAAFSKSIVSKYTMWFDKHSMLPFQMQRTMPHNTSFEQVKKAIVHDFIHNPDVQLPPSFSIEEKKRTPPIPYERLKGTKAPGWDLFDIANTPVSLTSLKSKVIVVQFTGVGCGPCHHSIPFVKQLVNDYRTRDFEFVAIETWSNNINGLIRYYNRNQMNFKFLKANAEVVDAYNVKSVPVFLILDEQRVIRDVISGYTENETDKRIIAAIEDLL